jgi:hypothetical protein
LSGTLSTASGGTGLTTTPGASQILIGTGTAYSLSTLTAGTGITITNAAGVLTIAATGGGAGTGTVTSVDASGGSTGLTFSGGPITSAGTLTLAGTLGTANLGLATLASPTFTGTPAAPTPAAGTNSTQLATTAFVTSYAMPVLRTSESATGTSIDFTSIPSWVKRVTVIFADLSLNGSANVLIQLGDSGGVETTGYVSTSNFLSGGSSSGATSSTAGIALVAQSAANALTGSVVFTKLSGNRWVATGVFNFANTTGITGFTAGDKSLSDTLDRIRVTNSASDTFDAGSINILYE